MIDLALDEWEKMKKMTWPPPYELLATQVKHLKNLQSLGCEKTRDDESVQKLISEKLETMHNMRLSVQG